MTKRSRITFNEVLGVVSILIALTVAVLATSLAFGAEPGKTPVVLQSITMSALDGTELNRETIGPQYESLDDCSKAQQETGTQHPEVKPGGPPTITVYMCSVVINGMQT